MHALSQDNYLSSLNYIWCETLVEQPPILRRYKPPKIRKLSLFIYLFFSSARDEKLLDTLLEANSLSTQEASAVFALSPLPRLPPASLLAEGTQWLPFSGMCKTVADFFFFFNLLNFTFIASRREFTFVTQPTVLLASHPKNICIYWASQNAEMLVPNLRLPRGKPSHLQYCGLDIVHRAVMVPFSAHYTGGH